MAHFSSSAAYLTGELLSHNLSSSEIFEHWWLMTAEFFLPHFRMGCWWLASRCPWSVQETGGPVGFRLAASLHFKPIFVMPGSLWQRHPSPLDQDPLVHTSAPLLTTHFYVAKTWEGSTGESDAVERSTVSRWEAGSGILSTFACRFDCLGAEATSEQLPGLSLSGQPS